MTDDTVATGPGVSAQDELKAMGAIDAALTELCDQDAKQRVMDWASGRHGLTAIGPSRSGRVGGDLKPRAGRSDAVDAEESPEFGDFSALYHAADPQNDRQRLLTAGYWIQKRTDEQNLHADNVNEILTPLGHRIERVRDVVPGLLTGSPRLMIRVGKNKGARGRVLFRLSAAGLKAVEDALAAGGFANVG